MICIVEDDRPVRESLVALLQSCGFSTIWFESAEDALGEPLPREVQCMIVDVRLPGRSGIELLRTLAAAGVVLPSLVMTGHGDAETLDQLNDLKFVRFIEKPFDPPLFLDCIRQILREYT